MKRIHFEDNGQDFTWWDITKKGEVVNCGPFQKDIWVGCWVDVVTVKVGGNLEYLGTDDGYYSLMHKIVKIETKGEPVL